MKKVTVKQIDKACLDPQCFVFIGNRQKVLGAAEKPGVKEPAPPGHVWVDVAGRTDWTLVKLSDVIIEKTKGDSMPRGKRASGSNPTHVNSSRKGARDKNPTSQPNIPGVDIDSRRIAEIEEAWETVREKRAAVLVAKDDLEIAERAVIETMHKHKFNAKRRPTYTRVGFGSIVLKEKGNVEETVRFVELKPKKAAAKKKNSKETEENSEE